MPNLKYVKEQSVLHNINDEYTLSEEEYYKLYSFYVTYSMCATQSMKKRYFSDYGWNTSSIETTEDGKKTKTNLGIALNGVLDLKSDNFRFYTEKSDMQLLYQECNLSNGPLIDFETERCVIGKTSESNKYLKLFYRIRDGLAHGKFGLKYSRSREKMIIIQDDDSYVVTARIVLKLSTVLGFVDAVDVNNILNRQLIACC